MESLHRIESGLRRVARRRRRQAAMAAMGRALLWAGCGVFLGVASVKLLPVPAPLVWGLGWVGAGGVLLSGLAAAMRRVTLEETARWVDERLELQERLATAMELRDAPAAAEWPRLVLEDAARHATGLDPVRLVPSLFPRPALLGTGALLLAGLLALLPAYRTPAQRQRQEEATSVAEAGRGLAALTREQLTERKPALEPTEKTLNEVAEFGDKLARLSTTRNEALRDLANLTQKVQDRFEQMGEKPGLRTLEKAAREPSGGSGSAGLEQRVAALKQALGGAADNREAVDRLKRELEKLKASAEKLHSADPAESRAAREQLAESMQGLAQSARAAGVPLASLEEAVTALQQADTGYFLRELNSTLQDLDKLQQLGQSLQQLREEMARSASDLPSQLKMGQAAAAQASLESMIRTLRSGSASAQDLDRITREVQGGIDPARDYGDVAGHLRKAAGRLAEPGRAPSAADREAASQHLADAASELADLQRQMADAQQLASTLETLQRAQIAIGNHQRFGECKACRRPGFSRGGKPGKGVGTWAEEEGWTQIPEETKGWDNSGIRQPELDPRSLADRGEGEHNPAMTPTKVRGQMSPGGSMQSITLKGVHVRGESHIRLEESTAAAQADAQAALNQDRVPRAYQQAVRNYFDDFSQPPKGSKP